MELVIFILSIWGLTNIVVNENVFRKPVEWLKNKNTFLRNVLSCETCFGFYASILIGLLIGFDITNYLFLDIIVYGIMGSGVCNIIALLKIKLEIW